MSDYLINVNVVGRVWVKAVSEKHAAKKVRGRFAGMHWNDCNTSIGPNHGESCGDVVSGRWPEEKKDKAA